MQLASVIVQEPRLDVQPLDQTHVTITQGAERITQVVMPALSYSDAQANWNIQPPKGVIIDRDILIRYEIEYTVDYSPFEATGIQALFQTDQSTGDTYFCDGYGFRQCPIGAVTESTSVILNGENLNDNISQKIHAFLCYGNTRKQQRLDWSKALMEPDLVQDYGTYFTSPKNPLVPYYKAGYEQNGRSPGLLYFTDNSAEMTATFRVRFTEPIWMSPFGTDYGQQKPGFCNVDSLNVIQRFKKLVHTLSYGGTLMGPDDLKTIPTATAKFYKPPELLINYLTPVSNFAYPTSQILPFIKPLDYVQQLTLAPQGQTTFQFDTIRLSTIPEAVYIFVAPSRSTTTDASAVNLAGEYVPDCFLNISRVNITFENQSSIMGTFQPEELFDICHANGLNLSFDEFRRYKGTVLKLNFSKDIGIPNGLLVGDMGSFTYQCSIDIWNQYLTTTVSHELSRVMVNPNSTTKFEAWQVFIMPGSLMIAPGVAKSSIGLSASAAAKRGSYYSLTNQTFVGGGTSNVRPYSSTGGKISTVFDRPFM